MYDPEPSDKWADRTMIVFFALWLTFVVAEVYKEFN